MLAVAVIGFFNAFALYCFWRATAISQSKTGIYAIFDDLLAMGLGWLLLGEGTFLTRLLSVGIVLAVLSTYLMARGEKLRLRKENLTSGGEKTSEESIIPWVFGFCVIWGVAIFSFRYFATAQGMHFSTFAFSWYAGALAGAFCVTKIPFKGNLAARSDQAGREANPQSLKQVWACSILFGVLNITGLVLLNIILKIAPLVAVMPANLVFASAVPVLVGLAIFKEYKQMNRLEMFSIVVGLTSVVVIAFGFR